MLNQEDQDVHVISLRGRGHTGDQSDNDPHALILQSTLLQYKDATMKNQNKAFQQRQLNQ